MAEKTEGKRKFALWIEESTLEQVRKWYKADNCSSQSEFIDKAIHFYIGFISSENGSDYLPKIIISTLKGIVNDSDNRISRILFKLAVEQAITMNVVVQYQPGAAGKAPGYLRRSGEAYQRKLLL